MDALLHTDTLTLILWGALAVLLIAAYRQLARGIGGMLDKRIDGVRRELEEARRLREEAQTTLAELQKKQRQAMGEAEAILNHAKEEAERLRAESAIAVEAALKRREQQSLDRIARAEAAALAAVRAQAVDTALAAAADLIGEHLSGAAGAPLIDAAIEDLPNRLH